MTIERQTDENQAALWNGSGGRGWVEAQGLMDTILRPFEDLLINQVRVSFGHRVLDVGCGTGSTTLAAARLLGATGHCVGVDISAPMIAAAEARAAQECSSARFIRADAGTHAFEPASFDTIISRFGVMFFDDFEMAFTNLRRAAADNAALRFIAWRSAAENPFMTAAEQAAKPLLGNLPERQPDAPGQFAFANRDKVRKILQATGWRSIAIEPVDVSCMLPEKCLAEYIEKLGPVGRALQDADTETRRRVIDTAREAFAPYIDGTEVRFDAACWMVCAGVGPQ